MTTEEKVKSDMAKLKSLKSLQENLIKLTDAVCLEDLEVHLKEWVRLAKAAASNHMAEPYLIGVHGACPHLKFCLDIVNVCVST